MGAKSSQIDQLFYKIVDIRKKVKLAETATRAATDPLQTYFKVAGASGRMAQIADRDLQKLLKVSMEAREFANSFTAKGAAKWKDSTWLIENLTEGTVGAGKKNQQGMAVLQNLKDKVNAVKEVTKAADSLADAVMASLHIDVKGLAANLTSLSAANPIVWKDIKAMNAATRRNLEAFTPNVEQALSHLRVM